MDEDLGRKAPAAYLSFKTFLSSIEALEHGIPTRLDRTFWRSQSGVVQGQIMMALRFFGLITADDQTTSELEELVVNKEHRKALLGAVLHRSYRAILANDLTKMSPRMLEEEMTQYGVTGETRRKAVAFFLRAAKYADLPMHPMLAAQIREVSANGKRRKKNGGRSSTVDPQTSGAESGTLSNSLAPESRHSLKLNSGGAVTLIIAADPFKVSPADRDFLFKLVDQIGSYANGISPAKEAD